MRILALILILSSNSLISQEIKKIDSDKSKINYSGSHFLHKWSSQNNNVSGLIQVNNNSITNIGIVAKVEDFKSGNSIKPSILSIPPTSSILNDLKIILGYFNASRTL